MFSVYVENPMTGSIQVASDRETKEPLAFKTAHDACMWAACSLPPLLLPVASPPGGAELRPHYMKWLVAEDGVPLCKKSLFLQEENSRVALSLS